MKTRKTTWKVKIFEIIWLGSWGICIWWADFRWELFWTGCLSLFLGLCYHNDDKEKKNESGKT